MTRLIRCPLADFLPLLLAAILSLAATAPLAAQTEGGIDWAGLRVSATGLGAPPASAVNAAQARAMAQRAAVTVARRNLLEVVKGVRIDSATLVANAMVVDDRIVSQVEGFIQGASVDEVRNLPDGSVQATVSLPLTGDLARLLLPLAKTPALPPVRPEPPAAATPAPVAPEIESLTRRLAAVEAQLTAQQTAVSEQAAALAELARQLKSLAEKPAGATTMPVPSAQPSPETEARLAAVLSRLEAAEGRLARLETPAPATILPAAPAPTAAVPAAWTGLVVDARGLGYSPCLKPSLVLDGRLFYAGPDVPQETAVTSGYARFYRKLEQAQRSEPAGSLPLTVAAQALADGGGLVLDQAAAESLRALLAGASVLPRCRVAIVF
jgi:hypothetical protein